MEETYSVVLTLVFQDMTTRNYTLTGMDESAYPYVRRKVQAINANMPTNFSQTFVSEYGSPCASISKAKIVNVQEEVIYRAN